MIISDKAVKIALTAAGLAFSAAADFIAREQMKKQVIKAVMEEVAKQGITKV